MSDIEKLIDEANRASYWCDDFSEALDEKAAVRAQFEIAVALNRIAHAILLVHQSSQRD